jgi:hypothetical protein
VQRIIGETGGIQPAQRHRSRLALTLAEREEISRALVAGDSIQSIASRLSRAPSTICREIKRNSGQDGYRAGFAAFLAFGPPTALCCARVFHLIQSEPMPAAKQTGRQLDSFGEQSRVAIPGSVRIPALRRPCTVRLSMRRTDGSRDQQELNDNGQKRGKSGVSNITALVRLWVMKSQRTRRRPRRHSSRLNREALGGR